ncbi:lysine -specific demethylase 4c-like protein [Colletotrichum plurivorum]|uniref:Lysine -specific demethylase 4c-like protein n=1 Tax=Colletotrichum plurivorum TaxID=2175906 RepID=A0A8H6KQM8_9PEZI|nr:lysine -specific demethylase 4c-like protein [Colletotrichum plurivorum]
MSTSSRFSFPHFPATTSRPSDDQIEAFLNEAAESPPRGNILYYVGPPLSPDFDSLLHPGEQLAQFTAIDGVNSYYWHAGQRFSGTSLHSEDGRFWSANLVLAGLKLWVVIAEYHTAMFEEFIRRNWKANRCAQFVRHLSLFISPRRLREEGIDFVVHCAGPGDMVITKPGQYHAVVNYTACFAVSINFLLPGGSVIPSNLRVCKQCGLYNLKHSSLRKVPCPPYVDKARSNMPAARHGVADRTKRTRQPILVEQVAHPHKKSKTALVQPELQQMVMQARKVDEFCSIPSYSVKRPPPPEVFKLALLIGSRPAIQQFCDLIRSRRDPNGDRAPLSLSDDVKTRIGQRISAIGRSQRRSSLEQLQVRLNQFHLARDIERSKKDRIRADTAFITGILEQAQCSKSVFERHRRLGNKWSRLCRGRAELMCFVFLDRKNAFGLSPDLFLELDNDSLDILHALLDNPYINAICIAAKAFLQSLDNTSEDVEFRWETEGTQLDRLPEERMLSLLQPLPSSAENTYDPESHRDSPLPKGWPENYPWPTDPTRIYDKSRMCDFCEEIDCDCIRKIPTSLGSRHRPRIKVYGELGRGLQAVAKNPGQAAYVTNDVIGFLTEEIVPAGTYNDGQALDFARPDLPGGPVVCQLLCVGGAGNCFRLLNHACNPSARLAQVRVSGRYMTAVKAVGEIMDGEQITIDRGKDWGKRQCL